MIQIDESAQNHQLEKLATLKSQRDRQRVQTSLDALRRAAETAGNTMPHILEAVRAYATLGEICDAFRSVFGTYRENSIL